MDEELAFLQSMQETIDPSENYEPEDVAETEAKDTLSTENSNHVQDLKEPISVTSAADDSGTDATVQSPAVHATSDIFPTLSSTQPLRESVASQSSALPVDASSSSSPCAPTLATADADEKQPKQPRVRAGFVEDDSDDSDEEYTPSADVGSPSGVTTSEAVAGGPSAQGPSVDASSQDISQLTATSVPAESIEAGNPDFESASKTKPPNGLSTLDTSTAETSASGAAPSQVNPPAAASSAAPTPVHAIPKARLPHDRVGILEDRITEDPRGDLDAWLSLIDEHRSRNKLDEARAVYERFFKVFPMAAEQWVAYANMELAQNDFYRLELIFNKTLLTIPNVQLWSLYLDYVRRRNNLTTDTAGTARTTVSQAYDFVLQNVGMDKESGRIWQDYVQFIRSGPGTIGGSSWQDQQKMDLLRKTYQRAICVPTSAVNVLWKEYDSFEMGLNKMTGRKFLQEKSPAYMTARSSSIELDNITRGLSRTTVPRLPPALGFDGDEEYMRQVDLWKRWIQWEKDDPLVLKEEDPTTYRARIIYAFKQSIMALRFWPEMWFEASEFSYQSGLDKDGTTFITQGMAANPESALLAFKHADHLEATLPADEGEEGLRRRGAAIREPYDKVLDALYDLINKAKAREAQEIARIEASASGHRLLSPGGLRVRNAEEEDDDERDAASDSKEAAKQAQIKIVQDGTAVHVRLLSRTISFAWVALMRAMRRVQGKGKVGDVVGGSRQIFTDARKRGRITSDVYVASALIEYHCYKDSAGTRIFERGMKLFPEDDYLALEYLKHLIAINDVTNARAVFETTVSRLAQKPETLHKAKPIYAFFHEFESQYGELSQVAKLESRMNALFPEDGHLSRFAHRHTNQGFDPTAVRPIVSPATQTRPKALPSIETHSIASHSPTPRTVPLRNSPKRPPPTDESDTESSQRPRKLQRGESPLKGAAGRRLDQQKRNQQQQQNYSASGPGGAPSGGPSGHWPTQSMPPPPLPREVLFLLSIIPRADTYPAASRFKAEEMVRLIQQTSIPTKPPPAGVRPSPLSMSLNTHSGPVHYTR